MPLHIAEMLRLFGMAGIQKGIVESETTIHAAAQGFGKLDDGRGQAVRSGVVAEGISEDVADEVGLCFAFGMPSCAYSVRVSVPIFVFKWETRPNFQDGTQDSFLNFACIRQIVNRLVQCQMNYF